MQHAPCTMQYVCSSLQFAGWNTRRVQCSASKVWSYDVLPGPAINKFSCLQSCEINPNCKDSQVCTPSCTHASIINQRVFDPSLPDLWVAIQHKPGLTERQIVSQKRTVDTNLRPRGGTWGDSTMVGGSR